MMGQCDVVIRLRNSLYGQDKVAHLRYEKYQNCLLHRNSVASKVDTCPFMSNTLIYVVYADDCLFWACSQCDIDNVMNSLKHDGPN